MSDPIMDAAYAADQSTSHALRALKIALNDLIADARDRGRTNDRLTVSAEDLLARVEDGMAHIVWTWN